MLNAITAPQTKSLWLAHQYCKWGRWHQRACNAASTRRRTRRVFLEVLKPSGLGESFTLSVFITHYQSMCIPVLICTCYFMADKRALIYSGATDNFIHPNFTKIMGVNLQELEKPKCIYNIDNTANKVLCLSGMSCSTWAGRLWLRRLARWWRSFCLRYSVRALGLWQ